MSLEIKISKNKVSYNTAMNALNKRVESLKNSQGNELLWILEHPTTFKEYKRYGYEIRNWISSKLLA